jgi:hypothetical protein
MDYIEFKLWKAALVIALAFLAGLFGFIETGSGAGSDKPPE